MQTGTRATLLEDWQDRRRRLDDRPGDAYAPLQRQLLEFLIRRYRDAPEAQQPARFPLPTATVVNTRQIIINHHLGQGKVAGVKSRAEADARVRRLVERLKEHSHLESSAENEHGEEEAFGDAGAAFLWNNVGIGRHLGGLYNTLASARESPADVKRLTKLPPHVAVPIALRAWRERIVRGLRDTSTTRALEDFTRAVEAREKVLDGYRASLGDISPTVCLRALSMIEAIGDLDDFSLLMDLLKLPKEELDDKERLEIVQTLRRLAVRLKVYGEDPMNY